MGLTCDRRAHVVEANTEGLNNMGNTRPFPKTMARVRDEMLGVQHRVVPDTLAYLTHVGERTCTRCGYHECACDRLLPLGWERRTAYGEHFVYGNHGVAQRRSAPSWWAGAINANGVLELRVGTFPGDVDDWVDFPTRAAAMRAVEHFARTAAQSEDALPLEVRQEPCERSACNPAAPPTALRTLDCGHTLYATRLNGTLSEEYYRYKGRDVCWRCAVKPAPGNAHLELLEDGFYYEARVSGKYYYLGGTTHKEAKGILCRAHEGVWHILRPYPVVQSCGDDWRQASSILRRALSAVVAKSFYDEKIERCLSKC